jgi:ribonucleoside-diphosphate reductase alpha chain
MTGGGIGVDYSVYRESGRVLGGSGGLASGPIPKMQMINSIGANVMQGGSRRSAMYASLHWKHHDIPNFLTAKDWDTMPVGDTGYTLKQIKEQDFNFRAPLDMTNISVNYDTEWLLNYWKSGDVGEVFKNNVKQFDQQSLVLVSILWRMKMKHYEMLALKYAVLTTVMCAIWGVSILDVLIR